MEEKFYNALAVSFQSDYRKLLKPKNQFGSWEAAFSNLSAAGKFGDPDGEWKKLEKLGIRLVLFEDERYPASLREIPHPPFGIYVLGDLDVLGVMSLAIVGTRKATATGRETAKNFSEALTRAGLQIVSGLALGIDAAAHEGCLSAHGRTIAVLGNGLDHFYPRFNERLGKRILASGGAVISEYPPGAPTLPYRFLERNRIVSGLSRGVLVVEAPKESGSLVTARFALEQNREVFVVPGPISHQNFSGSNQLIRAGAELVTAPEEILQSLNLMPAESPPSRILRNKTRESKIVLSADLSEKEKIIFEALGKFSEPVEIDKIAELANLEISEVSRLLTFLLVKNIVKEVDGGYTI